MSAAFDLLDKSILIPKLRAHGFPERVITIYIDFLSDRKVRESVSEPFDHEVGCVQEGPSGPLLFSLLVNNIYVRYLGNFFLFFSACSFS
jgi:hypothetical protein